MQLKCELVIIIHSQINKFIISIDYINFGNVQLEQYFE
jgi:hypothetical protein